MRHGIGRARLCDVAPCPERWPCRIHGTRRVGDYEHLGAHAGSIYLVLVPQEGVMEVVSCDGCGYGLCACQAPTLAEAEFVAPAACDDCGAREGLVPVAHGIAWGCSDVSACAERVVRAGGFSALAEALLA